MKLFLLLFLIAAGCSFGADLTGIWTGIHEGRGGSKDDIAFRFRSEGEKLTGKLFGDEFDVAITDGSVIGDQVRFTVINTNYYSRNKVTFVYSGSIKGEELVLVRERVLTPEDRVPTNVNQRPPLKQTIMLKRMK